MTNSHRLSDFDLPLIDLSFPKSNPLPTSFSLPLFRYGDKISWKLLDATTDADLGFVIGRFCLPAPHRDGQWCWNYLVLLAEHSPSAAWTVADTAWEDDLERLQEEMPS